MINPIKPEEILAAQYFPDEVIHAFNELIALNYCDGRAVIKQSDVLLRLEAVFSRQTVVDNGWLNIEELYRSAGWNVDYDKPGLYETYQATFIFLRP